ncbi:probable G-protein coupled receptor 149 [Scyliorhinus canicula]|uniref:probable G-protein coupled receptor 149 n=1 Tax=Scyliorhinus canicula TaxID=7830 RepID=UPI0018F5BC60|nr:probable G-protein coupled receptor 149 [Scyliorhinus canicula]
MDRLYSASGHPGVTGPTMDTPVAGGPGNVFLFSLTLSCTLLIFLGSAYSLLCLLRARDKNFLVLTVASLSVDDLLCALALSMFVAMQWAGGTLPNWVCTVSAALYLLQGVSSALKSSLIVSYNYYTTRRTRLHKGSQRPVPLTWLLAILWVFGLSMSVLPAFGWGTFTATPWGCFVDHRSSYVTLLVGLYALCLVVLIVFSVPLTYKLLCSERQQQTQLYPSYRQVTDGMDTASNLPTLDNPVDRTLRCLQTDMNWSSDVTKINSPHSQSGGSKLKNPTIELAQKRFSLILAMTKAVLWLPLMIQLLIHHVTKLENVSFETLGFVLTLLAAAITPVFVLSERWIHLPCGCIINCRKSVYTVASEPARAKRRGFEFNLSFQQGCGVYKISQANSCTAEESKSLSYQNLTAYESEYNKSAPVQLKETPSDTRIEISTAALRDSSPQVPTEQRTEPCKVSTCQDNEISNDPGRSVIDSASSPEASEHKLAQDEGRKLELVDWEWCRSKSERTPRQRPGGLSIPLCAFQGMVSLHAPTTGKTLSLSTYEISGEGRKITPVAKKVEVYRSKSVGHEPSAEDTPGKLADTSVKIHLEVLEICENEEALDTVSIISNISQSSTQARSPSLRYSRCENRFVSVDLTESASYSLLIPTGHSGSDINISIPDTVEAHRQNSHRQHRDRSGYQEEIQLLNEAYRRQEEISNNC